MPYLRTAMIGLMDKVINDIAQVVIFFNTLTIYLTF